MKLGLLTLGLLGGIFGLTCISPDRALSKPLKTLSPLPESRSPRWVLEKINSPNSPKLLSQNRQVEPSGGRFRNQNWCLNRPSTPQLWETSNPASAPSPLELGDLGGECRLVSTHAADSQSEENQIAQASPQSDPTSQSDPISQSAEQLNLDPQVIQDSPVLRRWLQEVPDVRSDIRNDPSFRTRIRLGYSQFPSTDQAAGFNVGVEDVFLGRTGLTLSGEYQRAFNGDRQAYGADLRYYVLPLGGYFNIAPVVGYRRLETDEYTSDGINLGLRLLLSLSRTGAADISLTQSWVAPGTAEEVGITTLSFGYAITHNLRLSTDLQKQNALRSKDSRVGIVLEWML